MQIILGIVAAVGLFLGRAHAEPRVARAERVALVESKSLWNVPSEQPAPAPAPSPSTFYLETSVWVGKSTVAYRDIGSGWVDESPSTELATRIAAGRRFFSNGRDHWRFDVGAVLDLYFVKDASGLGASRLGGRGLGIEGRVGKEVGSGWRRSLRGSLGIAHAGEYAGNTTGVATFGLRFDKGGVILGVDLVQNTGVLTYEARLDLAPPVNRYSTGLLVGIGVDGRPAKYAAAAAGLAAVAAAVFVLAFIPQDEH